MSDLLIEKRLELLSVEDSEKQSKAKPEAAAEANSEPKPEIMAETNPEAMPDPNTEAQIQEAHSEVLSETHSEVVPETHSEALSETYSEVLSDVASETETVQLETNNETQFGELHDPIPECPESPIVAQECPICLDEITELCYPNVCNHMFCFPCLRYWSQVRLYCPLCKRTMSIIYRSERVEEVTDLVQFERQNRVNRVMRFQQMISRIIRGNAIFDDYQLFRATERIYLLPRGISPLHPVDARGQRFRVYTENLWALPVPNVGNGYFSMPTATFYAENRMFTHRLYEFILRDVGIIKYIIVTYGIPTLYFNHSIANYLMDMILRYNILDKRMHDLLEKYFGNFTAHFFHELFNFACCPSVNIIQYDLDVTFTPEYSYSSGVIANGPVTIRIPVCVHPSIREGRLPIPNEFLYAFETEENGHTTITLPMVADLLPGDGPHEEDNPTNRPFGLRLRGICPARVGSSWYFRPSEDFIRAPRVGSSVLSMFRLITPRYTRAAQLGLHHHVLSGDIQRISSLLDTQPVVAPPELPAPELTPPMDLHGNGSSFGILPTSTDINDHPSDTSEIPRNNDESNSTITPVPHSSNNVEGVSAHTENWTVVVNKKRRSKKNTNSTTSMGTKNGSPPPKPLDDSD